MVQCRHICVLLAVIFGCQLVPSSAIPASCIEERGALYPCPDGATAMMVEEINITYATGIELPVSYYGLAVDQLFMTSNGLILFDNVTVPRLPNTRNFTEVEMSFTPNNGIMALWSYFDFAPFYASSDVEIPGELSASSADDDILAMAAEDLTQFRFKPIEVNWGAMFTWYEFPFGPEEFKTNSSFQVLLVTAAEDVDMNGEDDLYAIFNYDQLEQTFIGEEKGPVSESSTFYRYAADNKYFSRNGHFVDGSYYELNALSGGASMNLTHLSSNVQEPGRWVIPLFENTTALKNYARNTWFSYDNARMVGVEDFTSNAVAETSWSENAGLYKRESEHNGYFSMKPRHDFSIQNVQCFTMRITINGVAQCGYNSMRNTDEASYGSDGFLDGDDTGSLLMAYFSDMDDPNQFGEGGYGFVQKFPDTADENELEDFARMEDYIYYLSGKRQSVVYMMTITWEYFPMDDNDDPGETQFAYAQLSIAVTPNQKNYLMIGFKSFTQPYHYDSGVYAGWVVGTHDYGGEVFALPRSGTLEMGLSTTESNIGIPGIWVLPLYYTYGGLDTMEHRFNPCRMVECENDAMCMIDGATGDWYCSCPLGTTGTLCEQEDLMSCTNVTCENNGTCVAGIGDYMCKCPTGFVGAHCETFLNLEELCSLDDNGGCSHTCSVTDEGVQQCLCDLQYELDSDGLTCIPSAALAIKVTLDETWDADLATPSSATAQEYCAAIYQASYPDTSGHQSYSCDFEEGSIISSLRVVFASQLSSQEVAETVITAEQNVQSNAIEVGGSTQTVSGVVYLADGGVTEVAITSDPCDILNAGSYCKNGMCQTLDGVTSCLCEVGWSGERCDVYNNDDGYNVSKGMVAGIWACIGLLFIGVIVIIVLIVVKGGSNKVGSE